MMTCSKCLRILVRITFSATALWSFMMFTSFVVYAEVKAEQPITNAELDVLDQELASQIMEIRDGRLYDAKALEAIYTILERRDLPEGIREKLNFQAAKLERNDIRAVDVFESLLNDNGRLQDVQIRMHIFERIKSHAYSFGTPEHLLTTPQQLLERVDRVAAPLLATPSDQYDVITVHALSKYADTVLTVGYQVADELEPPEEIKEDYGARQIFLYRERIRYAEESRKLLLQLLSIVDNWIDERHRSDGSKQDPLGATDDQLRYRRGGIVHLIERAEHGIDRMHETIAKYEKPEVSN